MHPFRRYLVNYTNLSQEEWLKVEGCLELKIYKKGQLVLEEGKICRKLYFLESGFLRFFITKEGLEVTKYFTAPPYCFTSQRSFTNAIPTNDNIEALEQSTIWEMTKEDAFMLLNIPNWNTFVRKLVQEVQFYTEQILEELQNKTAEERYIEMIEEGNILLEKVPQKHLASYLGIAPQSLSRIRKKYFDQKRGS